MLTSFLYSGYWFFRFPIQDRYYQSQMFFFMKICDNFSTFMIQILSWGSRMFLKILDSCYSKLTFCIEIIWAIVYSLYLPICVNFSWVWNLSPANYMLVLYYRQSICLTVIKNAYFILTIKQNIILFTMLHNLQFFYKYFKTMYTAK